MYKYKVRNTKYKAQATSRRCTRYNARGARCKGSTKCAVQGIGHNAQGTRRKVQGTRCTVQYTRRKVRNTWRKVHGTRCNHVFLKFFSQVRTDLCLERIHILRFCKMGVRDVSFTKNASHVRAKSVPKSMKNDETKLFKK